MKTDDNLVQQTLKKVRSCDYCRDHLPHGVRPVLQLSANSKILIVGQAPGSKVHETGIPFDDPSGDRLRAWMGVAKVDFYNTEKIAILPMGFCYHGRGKSGDLPPREECAKLWRHELMELMPSIELTLIVGQYAIAWHLPHVKQNTLTATVKRWQEHWPNKLPIPHPSPRNNIWLKKNAWFEIDVVPALQQRVASILSTYP